MSDRKITPLLERQTLQLLNPNADQSGGQWQNHAGPIVVLGTSFHPVEGPSPRMLARLKHARDLYLRERKPIIPTGGIQGTSGTDYTEAELIGGWFTQQGISPAVHETFSRESVGNIALTQLGMLSLLGEDAATFVTDHCHAPRVQLLAEHILRGLAQVTLAAAPWPLSRDAEIAELANEARGMVFVEQLLREVPPGRPIEALHWVSDNHRAGYYRGWDLNEVVAILRGNTRDYIRRARQMNAEVPVGTQTTLR